MQLNLIGAGGEPAKATVDVADLPFCAEYNEPLVHQVVTAYLAAARRGTKRRKSRADVSGGGIKPFRQKGTGRARAGSIRSPLWRGGGATFAARPRSYAQKVNRKMYRGAMRSIVSELIRRERLSVVESLSVERPKTKDVLARLSALGLSDVLIVTAEHDLNLLLSVRNLHGVAAVTAHELNPVNLLAFDKVLVTVDALKQLEERLA